MVVAGGCFVALIIALIEFLLNIEKIAIEEKVISILSRYTFTFSCNLNNLDFTMGRFQIGIILRLYRLDYHQASSI